MRKTKKELIRTIAEMEGQLGRLTGAPAGQHAGGGEGAPSEQTPDDPGAAGGTAETASLRTQLDDLRDLYDRLVAGHGDLKEERDALSAELTELRERQASLEDRFIHSEEAKAGLRESYEDLSQEMKQLKRKHERTVQEKAMLTAQFTALQADYHGARERLKACESQYNAHYALFKSFVDSDAERVLLLDVAYTIRYINQSALQVLGIVSGDEVIGSRLFDLLPYRDALKLKEKIDKTFLEGTTEKAKKISFSLPEGETAKLKIKLQRVNYQDRPSIKMILK